MSHERDPSVDRQHPASGPSPEAAEVEAAGSVALPATAGAGGAPEASPAAGEGLRSLPGRWLGRLEEGLVPATRRLLSWLPLALAIASVPGLVGWALFRGDLGFLLDNQLAKAERIYALLVWIASVLLVGIGYGVFAARQRRRAGQEVVASFHRLNRALLVLLALPPALLFLVPKVETSHPFLVLSFAAAIAAIVGVWVYHLGGSHPAPGERIVGAQGSAGRRFGPWLAVVGMMAAYAVGFSWLAIVQHHGLATRIYDLGIYDNIFWQSIHGNPLGSTFVKSGSHVAAHVDPILVLLSPLYLIYPRAELILVLQSVWLALGAIPLFLLAREVLGSPWLGVVFAAIYLLYPALHGANLYEFHSLTLAAPLLLAAMAALELGRLRLYALFIGLLLLTREDLSLLTCFIGLYAILAKERVRLGLVTILASTLYLAVIKLFVMPDPGLLMSNTSKSYGYAYYYEDLIPYSGEGTFGLLVSLLINPIFAIRHVFTEAKILFLARLFLPLLFLPFTLRTGKIVLVYGLAFLLLSSRGPVHSIYFQYPVVLFPLAMALTPLAIAELARRRWPRGVDGRRLIPSLSLAALAATVAVSVNYGAIVPNDAFRGGFQRLVRSLTPEQKERWEWVKGAVARIPPDASVSATSRLGPHVSNRRKAVIFPAAADYYFLDRADLRSRGRDQIRKMQRSPDFELVDSRKSITLWRRRGGAPAEAGAAAQGAAEAGIEEGAPGEEGEGGAAGGGDERGERARPRGNLEQPLVPRLELPLRDRELIPILPPPRPTPTGPID